ncbi:hypothetical protein QF002_007041 [Paraburkholderia youngii]
MQRAPDMWSLVRGLPADTAAPLAEEDCQSQTRSDVSDGLGGMFCGRRNTTADQRAGEQPREHALVRRRSSPLASVEPQHAGFSLAEGPHGNVTKVTLLRCPLVGSGTAMSDGMDALPHRQFYGSLERSMKSSEFFEDSEDTQYTLSERAAAASRSTWVSVGVNLMLTVTQVAAGVLSHSQGLIADGVHSLSDLPSQQDGRGQGAPVWSPAVQDCRVPGGGCSACCCRRWHDLVGFSETT